MIATEGLVVAFKPPLKRGFKFHETETHYTHLYPTAIQNKVNKKCAAL